jgi:hypothetical protein
MSRHLYFEHRLAIFTFIMTLRSYKFHISMPEREEIKILGVKLRTDLNMMVALNYEQLIAMITGMLHVHSGRRQNLVQKIWFTNSFVLSKLWYMSQILPPDKKHTDKIKKLICRFLWAGFLYKI